jgi:hypothetical protein
MKFVLRSILQILCFSCCLYFFYYVMPSYVSTAYSFGYVSYSWLFQNRRISKQEVLNIQTAMTDPTHSRLWLIVEKPFLTGHSEVVYQYTQDGVIKFKKYANYPLFGLSKIDIAGFLDEVKDNKRLKIRYESRVVTLDQIERLDLLFHTLANQLTISIVSEAIPIFWRRETIFNHCASIAAKLYNRATGTNYLGTDPFFLGRQLKNRIYN